MNTRSTRRSFLRRAVLAATVLPFAEVSGAFAPVQRVGGALLKPAINAFSFLELLNANMKDASQGIDLFGVCGFCAQHDIEAVDLTGYFFPGYPKAPEDSYIYRLKRHAHALGLTISGTGVRNDFTAADRSVRAEGVQRLKLWIEVAAKLGAPTIRAFADSQPPFKNWQEASGHAPRDTVEAWMAEALRECAGHGKKFGVIVAVQNHGDFINSGAEHLNLLKRVDHEWCGALIDTGKYPAPVLEDPARAHKDAAFTLVTRGPQKVGQSVRFGRWRFTQRSDGTGELYDHDAMPASSASTPPRTLRRPWPGPSPQTARCYQTTSGATASDSSGWKRREDVFTV